MSSRNVFVMAGGTGVTHHYLNTIENKVSKNIIIRALEADQNYDNYELDTIRNNKNDSFSVWGYSEKDNNLKYNPPKKGDIIFITKDNAAVYMATIFEIYDSKELNFIWAGRESWRYKLIFENVIRIFIPYPKDVKTEMWFEEHSFSPGVSTIGHIIECYRNKLGFRNIIGEQDKKGPIQGALKVRISSDKVLDNLLKYFIKTHFECIVKEI